jgi:uncharacterized damage-inducible protein DinB
MTYYGGKDLAAAFRTVRKNTIKTATDIPEDQYDFRATPDTRTIREMLVHIGLGTLFANHIHRNGVSDMGTVNFQELMATMNAEQARPRTKADIIAFLQTDGDSFASYLEGLSDSFLAEDVTMMPGGDPPAKTRFELLMSVKEHEMHHRGQLMLMQRLIGVVPHLTRERQEWAKRWQAEQAAQAQR